MADTLALGLGMLVVVGGILVLRLHAFLALIAGALVVAAVTPADAVRQSLLHGPSWTVVAIDGERITLDGADDDGTLPDPGAFVLLDHDEKDGTGPDELSVVVFIRFDSGPDGRSIGKVSRAVDVVEVDEALRVGDRLVERERYDAAREVADAGAMGRVASAFGGTAGKIGILIGLATVIGTCLLVSGSAERIVRTFQAVFGERRTPLAFVVSSFILAIPVFFDTVFFLMLPLAKAMAAQTGRDYVKYVLAIVVGGTLAHSLVPPTPGPLFVATELGVGLDAMALGGIAVGTCGVAVGYVYMIWINRVMPIPLRSEVGQPDSKPHAPSDGDDPDCHVDRDAVDLPPFGLAILPVVLPLVLLFGNTVWGAVDPSIREALPMGLASQLDRALGVLGEKNMALACGAVVALVTLLGRPGVTRVEATRLVQRGLSEGGVVVLITCAGGAFGEVIRQTDIGATLSRTLPVAASGVGLLVAAFTLTMIIRAVQGSATVAMITTVGILGPVASQVDPGFHPVYLALAIGTGSKPLPWMNDSGFWVVGRMTGFNEAETLKTFSVLLTIMGVVAFAATVVAAMLLPMR